MAIINPAEGGEEGFGPRRGEAVEADLGQHAKREPRPPPFGTKTAAAFSITLKGWNGIPPGLVNELLIQAADRIEALWRRVVWDHIYEETTPWAEHRTFELPKSFEPVRSFSKNEVRIGYTSDSVYADVQDKGRTVVPVKPMRTVAIPLSTSAAIVSGATPADFDRSELKKAFNSKTGVSTLGMFVGKGKAKEFVPLFVLKDSVTIPPKKYLERSDEDVAAASPAILGALLHGMAIRIRADKVDNFEIDSEGNVKKTSEPAAVKPARQVVLRKGGGRK